LIAVAQELPLGSLAWSRDNRDDPQLLPKLADRPQHGCFGHFPAKCVLQAGNVGVARLKQFVGLHGQLRNLARTCQLRAASPITISP
jgi:hypothetical protein